jgi:hypothetical protein
LNNRYFLINPGFISGSGKSIIDIPEERESPWKKSCSRLWSYFTLVEPLHHRGSRDAASRVYYYMHPHLMWRLDLAATIKLRNRILYFVENQKHVISSFFVTHSPNSYQVCLLIVRINTFIIETSNNETTAF